MRIILLPEEKETVRKLGLCLKSARLKSNQTLVEFGARIGVSRWTVSQMEKGNPHVSLAGWIKAGNLLGLLDTWSHVLEAPADPFAEYDRARLEEERLSRSRAGKKKKSACNPK